MPAVAAIAEINDCLDKKKSEEAAQIVIDRLAEFTDEQQIIYRVLDGLYKEENGIVLKQLIDCLKDKGLLRRESLIFTMRMAFQAKEYRKRWMR